MNQSSSGPERLAHLLNSRSTSTIVLESSIALLIFLVAVPGNVLVLLVVYKTPRLRNAAGILITSLAISDIVLLLFEFPITFSAMITGRWLGGFYLCQIAGYAVPFLCSASVQTMALMALDRHFRISHPVRHRTIFSVKRTKLMALLVWLAASTVQLPYVANGGVYTFHPGKGICFVEFTLLANVGIIYLVLPSIVVQHFYMKVFLALRANKKRVQTLQGSTDQRPSQNDNTRSQVNKNFISNRAGICHLLDSGYDNRFGGHGSWWLGPSTWGLYFVYDLRSRKFLYKSPDVWDYEQSIP